MQGVRRWMGSQPRNVHHKAHRTTHSRSEAKNVKKEVETGEKNNTEQLVRQLMDPKVPEKELEQYEG